MLQQLTYKFCRRIAQDFVELFVGQGANLINCLNTVVQEAQVFDTSQRCSEVARKGTEFIGRPTSNRTPIWATRFSSAKVVPFTRQIVATALTTSRVRAATARMGPATDLSRRCCMRSNSIEAIGMELAKRRAAAAFLARERATPPPTWRPFSKFGWTPSVLSVFGHRLALDESALQSRDTSHQVRR